jgi:hypothetical protein
MWRPTTGPAVRRGIFPLMSVCLGPFSPSWACSRPGYGEKGPSPPDACLGPSSPQLGL